VDLTTGSQCPVNLGKPVFRSFSNPASMAASQHHQPVNQSKVGVLIGNGNKPSSRRCDTPPALPRYGSQPAISMATESSVRPRCSDGTWPAMRLFNISLPLGTDAITAIDSGSAGFAAPHQVHCWPGELCDCQRSGRNGNRHEWIDGACNHNDSARAVRLRPCRC
jgi:hypothetical protein